MNLFLFTETSTTPSWILPIVLLAILIGMFAFNTFRQKKYRESAEKLVSELKVGDKVKTYSGMYGTIVEIQNLDSGKVAVLKTGTENFVGFYSIDINAIYSVVDLKTEIKVEDITEVKKEEAIEVKDETIKEDK
ncbi:MAG: preprotein translocase subunit YajC [Clostridia bacterium]